MKISPDLPVYIIGGVISYHPYLNTILSQKFKKEIEVVENAQYIVSLGAAMIAKNSWVPKDINDELSPELISIQ